MAVLACRVVFGTTLLVFGVLLLGANNGRTAGVIACAGGIWGILASLREGIWIDEQGVAVRGALTTRRLPWANIASFSMDESAWPAYCLLIHLRNGRAVKVKALLKPRFGPKAKYRSWILEELNEALAKTTLPAPPDAHMS
jgi:hypothetical protein